MQRTFYIKSCYSNISVYLRTFISGLLILALLPVSSFAAICGASCRMAGMADMPAHSPAMAAHHHDDDDLVVAEAHNKNGHTVRERTCCNGDERTVSSSCLMSKTGVVQEPALFPKFRAEFAALQIHGPASLIIKEPAHWHASPNGSTLIPSLRSLTLRI